MAVGLDVFNLKRVPSFFSLKYSCRVCKSPEVFGQDTSGNSCRLHRAAIGHHLSSLEYSVLVKNVFLLVFKYSKEKVMLLQLYLKDFWHFLHLN